MKNLIIDRIIRAWNKVVMINESISYRYSDLAFEIINLSTMIDTLKIRNPRICLSASNSFEWIIVFLTALIKGIPIHLVSHKYDPTFKMGFITKHRLNIIFVSDLDEQEGSVMPNHEFTKALIRMSPREGFVVDYLDTRVIDKHYKKLHKWNALNAIDKRETTKTLFKSFEDDAKTLVYICNSGVNRFPESFAIDPWKGMRTNMGMVAKLTKLDLKKKNIGIEVDFNWFALMTIIPIINLGSTLVINRRQRTSVDAIIGGTKWIETMWDSVAEGQTESRRRWYEKWVLTKWINTIKLKNEFKWEFGETLKNFIILNDETHFRLKSNLERIGYVVTSTYGTTRHQLISIDQQLINGINIKVGGDDPSKWAGVLFVAERLSHAEQWIDTGDIAIMGKDSELIIHGRAKDQIQAPDGTLYNPNALEKIVRSNELIDQALVIKNEEKTVLLIHFKPFTIDALGKTKADTINIAKDIKAEINSVLPAEQEVFISSWPKPLDENEQGKIIRAFYTNTPRSFA